MPWWATVGTGAFLVTKCKSLWFTPLHVLAKASPEALPQLQLSNPPFGGAAGDR